jgi:hypothetical protein
MVNCTDLTDEIKCSKHAVCSCDWREGSCLDNRALPYDEQKCNKLLGQLVQQNNHTPTVASYNIILNKYIRSFNSEEKKKYKP